MASCVFVSDEVMNFPFLVTFSACPSSYSCKIQEFKDNLSTCWSELPEGSAGREVRQARRQPRRPSLSQLLVEQPELLRAELSFILFNLQNSLICFLFFLCGF